MSGWRIGDGGLQTHGDWLHGLHGLQHGSHGWGQAQLHDFWLPTLPAANGIRRGCELVVAGTSGSLFPGEAGEY
jgi:hypothetical protein